MGWNLWIYTYINKAIEQINYILINKKRVNSVLNCVVYFSTEGVSSDHRIVKANIRLSVRRSKTKIAKTTHHDLSSLNNRYICNNYALTVRNKLITIQEIAEALTLKNEYGNFFNTYMEESAEFLPTKLKDKCRIPWDTLAVRKKIKEN